MTKYNTTPKWKRLIPKDAQADGIKQFQSEDTISRSDRAVVPTDAPYTPPYVKMPTTKAIGKPKRNVPSASGNQFLYRSRRKTKTIR
jgi:hypothetical protein